MGIALQATLPHALDATAVAQLPERAAQSPQVAHAAADLHAALRARWPALGVLGDFATMRWPDAPPMPAAIVAGWSAGHMTVLEWAGFSIYIAPRVVVATHIEKFGAFVDASLRLQRPLRDAVRALARCFDAHVAIYAADSAHPTQLTWERAARGASFAEIVEALRVNTGPAADDIANCERIVDGRRALSGWFLDRFDDRA